MVDPLALIAVVGLPLAIALYVVFHFDQVVSFLGAALSLVSRLVRVGDRKATRLRVQGDVNAARADMLRNAPDEVLDSKLKLKWTDAECAQAIIREGDVLVCMRKSRHHEENLAHALMAYLPKAVVPRARRYVDACTMKAADLTIAKAILGHIDGRPGALDVFFDEHLDPARANDAALRQRVI